MRMLLVKLKLIKKKWLKINSEFLIFNLFDNYDQLILVIDVPQKKFF